MTIAGGRKRYAVFRASALVLVALMVAQGCATQQEIAGAIGAVNQAFRAEYEGILGQKGTRVFSVPKQEAFVAMRATLARLGMQAESQDPELGFLSAFASAPRPLDLAEWRRAAETDLPHMREIAADHIGTWSQYIKFEPEGLQVVINASVIEASAGSNISLTMRLREITPPRSGIPRREYAPPTAVRMGLDKIWAEFEREQERRRASK